MAASKILRRHRAGCFLAAAGQRHGQRLLLDLAAILDQRQIGLGIEAAPVLLLLDAQDIGGPAEPGEQIGPVLGIEEAPERFDPAHGGNEVILPRQGEDGIDQIIAAPRARADAP